MRRFTILVSLLCLSVAAFAADATQEQQPTATHTPQRPSEPHLYWHLLDVQNHLDRKAALLEKQGESRKAQLLRDHFQTQLHFTEPQFQMIRAQAIRLEGELNLINAKAMPIIARDRAWIKLNGRSHGKPPGHAEVHELEQEREATIKQAVADLNSDLGPELAARLKNYVDTEWAFRLTAHPAHSRAAFPPGGAPVKTKTFLTLRLAILALAFGFALVGLPKAASAQQDIIDDETVDVTEEFCDPDEGDDCEVESYSSIEDTTTTTELDIYDATYITYDLLDYGYGAYVGAYVYQDADLIYEEEAFDDGSGEAIIEDEISINLSGGSSAFENYADSEIYDEFGDFYDILETETDVTLGSPEITSVSPPYVYVGTSGTLTIYGQALVDPFGGGSTTVSAVAASPGATGLTLTAGSFGDTSGTASYYASLTATTGPWDIGLNVLFGDTIYTTTAKGLFTVGHPTPSITSVSPNTWTAGTLNFNVTISGSYFGSNPQLTIAGGGATLNSITSHSDNGEPGGAVINANVSVANACQAAGTATITVTSTGYNGTGFVSVGGSSSTATSTATIVPAPGYVPSAADPPTITYNNSNIQGATTGVYAGQLIALTANVPTQACIQVQSWTWTPPSGGQSGSAIGGYTPTTGSHNTASVTPLPATNNQTYNFYFAYAGTYTVKATYTLYNGDSATSTATFMVTEAGGGNAKMTRSALPTLYIANLAKSCKENDGTLAQNGTYMIYAKGATGWDVGGPTGCETSATQAGISFSENGFDNPGSGSFELVQLISSDVSTGGLNANFGPGLDSGAYPYATTYAWG